MKDLRLSIIMLMVFSMTLATFIGCAKDYDDDIKRLENSADTQIASVKKGLEDQLTLVNGQINVLNTVTVPTAIAAVVKQAKDELTAVKGVLETRIGAIETDLKNTKISYDAQLLALAELKGSTNTTLLLYGEKMAAIETAANLLAEKVGSQAISINTLTINTTNLRNEYNILKANYDAMIPTLATNAALNAQENALKAQIQQQAIDLKAAYQAADAVLKEAAKQTSEAYTDKELNALKQNITDTYGPYIPEIENLMLKLGLKDDKSLGVIDDLTGRIVALESLNIDTRLSKLEADFDSHLTNYATLLGRVDGLKDITDALTAEDVLIWKKINDEVMVKLAAFDTKFGLIDASLTTIGGETSGLLGQLFTAKAKAADDIDALKVRAAALEADMLTKVNASDLATQLATINSAIAAHDTKATSEIATAITKALDDARKKSDSLDKELKEYLIAQFGIADTALKTALQKELETAIAKATADAQNALDEQVKSLKALINTEKERIDAINTTLTELTTRVAALETNVSAILSRVQSISFLSDYGDAKLKVVAIGSTSANSKFSFVVSPASKATEIVSGYTNGKIAINFLTNVTSVRSIDQSAEFKVSKISVTDAATGVVTVELTNPQFATGKFYALAMKIKDIDVTNGTEFLTQFVPIEVISPFTASTSFDFKAANSATKVGPNAAWNTTETVKLYTNGKATGTLLDSERNTLKALNNSNEFKGSKDMSVTTTIDGITIAAFASANGLEAAQLTTTVSLEAQYNRPSSSTTDVLLTKAKVQLNSQLLSAINNNEELDSTRDFSGFVLKIVTKYGTQVINTQYAYFTLESL